MSELDTLSNEFNTLLKGVGTTHTLAEWRYAYRKVIYTMGLKILEQFPEIIIGQPPGGAGIRGGGGSGPGPHAIIDYQQPPYRPSAVVILACLALGDCPPDK